MIIVFLKPFLFNIKDQILYFLKPRVSIFNTINPHCIEVKYKKSFSLKIRTLDCPTLDDHLVVMNEDLYYILCKNNLVKGFDSLLYKVLRSNKPFFIDTFKIEIL